MELQKLRKDIGEEKEIDAGYMSSANIPIDSFIEWLQVMKRQGATHIDIDGRSDREGDVDEITLQAFQEYIETPEQAKKRIETERSEKKGMKERQFEDARQIYEYLKKIFENN